MRIVAATLLIIFTIISCSTDPQPLEYGTDACSTCKMTLMDQKFGAELVTSKGKVYKFDDVNCMLTFYNSEEMSPENFAHRLVIDYSQPAKLIPAADAFYLKSPEIKSPMASQIAAFERKESMEEVKKRFKGIYLVWGELVTQFK